jgi:large subunit ribosomal protein L9
MANPIRVVLQQDVDNLGAGGEVVRVRPGYARNFLIPRGLALPATAGNLSRVEEFKKQAAQKAALLLKEAQELKQKLEAASIKLERAVGADAKMYGSVTPKDIEEAYRHLGLAIDRRKLDLADPIKVLGLSEVVVKLHAQVSATLRVEVVKASS